MDPPAQTEHLAVPRLRRVAHRAAALTSWLTAPDSQDDEPIRPQLGVMGVATRNDVLRSIIMIAILVTCCGCLGGLEATAPLAMFAALTSAARWFYTGPVQRARGDGPMLAATLACAFSAGLIGGVAMSSGHRGLMVIAAVQTAAIAVGHSMVNAGIPRAARLSASILIITFVILTAISLRSEVLPIVLLVPVWLMVIFTVVARLHAVLARSLWAQRMTDHLANHDPLTGLPNRARFMQCLQAACDVAAHPGAATGHVLYLDLDGFKAVNDSLGHIAGDQLLRAVSQGFTRALGEGDILARLGGDEFAVILSPAPPERVHRIAEALVHVATAPFQLDGLPPIRIGVSIGGATLAARLGISDLLHLADTMLYEAKRSGRGTFRLAPCPATDLAPA
ncbi:diguanylate cyclase (GGDEF)-like protein [Endobacter medicaginis]|uniref:Diguanylate cyclase (GGDEF)-like protein n=2 Tax=Endobacter medicaginis TaxID=1181271 RepID=A0A839UV93_9PROT|nr:GGDEF domain-containing protein [Endobacter medicaginis]MBB3172555.1 diguanylate cyclase (GGDEF)-like protein [Endobacter medicaginis]MCX5473957.1 GGDEF domain-containing protein [Endobacter medicaginis]